MLTMVHSNVASLDEEMFKVDRKFHTGMTTYAGLVRAPLVTVHPEASPNSPIMDPVEVPRSQLPYTALIVKTDKRGRPLASELPRITDQIRKTQLLYGSGLGTIAMARAFRVPYIMILEYDLATQISVTTAGVQSTVRRWARTSRCSVGYASSVLEMLGAHSLHCNGFPIFEATRFYNINRLLYLDSRMSGDMVIDADELDGRLRARPGRSLRLLYSGRYEKIKGADDVVRVAATCLRRGIDIELHCYGQGSLRESMKLLAGDYPDHIHVHDALPFATLVEKSKSFDAFVCCHIQNDPSCTYLEAFGCGLPVIGYANRMWKKLCDVSKAGMVSRMHDIASLANNIAYISHEFEFLAACSHRARAFALGHTFELEFAKRTSSLNEALAGKRVR